MSVSVRVNECRKVTAVVRRRTIYTPDAGRSVFAKICTPTSKNSLPAPEAEYMEFYIAEEEIEVYRQ